MTSTKLNMQTALTVPFDILAYIADTLGASGRHQATLKALSLTCKFLLPICRRHLFSSLRLLNSQEPTTKRKSLASFLNGSPEIVFCLKKLKCALDTRSPTTSQHIIDIFKVLRTHRTLLQSITILSLQKDGFDWNLLEESMQSALIFLIQLPTVTRIHLDFLLNFPLVALSLCSDLNNFSVQRVCGETICDGRQIITRSKIPAPVVLEVNEGTDLALSILMQPSGTNDIHPIMDFSYVQDASFEILNGSEASQMNKLLKTMTDLRLLFIDCM